MGGSFGPLQYQLAPKSSILIGLMIQKDVGLHGIVLVVIVVVIHKVIHIPKIINVILIRIFPIHAIFKPIWECFWAKKDKNGSFC